MPRSRRFGRSRFTLILLILASLTILTLDYRDTGPVQGVRGAAATVFSPFRAVGDAVATPFRNGWNGIFGYDELEDKNDELRRELDELRGRESEAAAAADENDELRRQLGLPVADDIERVTAEVVSAPLTDLDATIEINRGSGDGIRRGMAVITDAGLVGRIAQVTGGRSRVLLITDPDFEGLGVRLVPAGDVGVATGSPDGTLRVDEGIELDTPVERGDLLVTSGYEISDYPGNIPVGSVTSVGRTTDQTEKTLVVEPAADLVALRFVSVLLCDQDCG